jgi:hypothetical protein
MQEWMSQYWDQVWSPVELHAPARDIISRPITDTGIPSHDRIGRTQFGI